MERNVSSGTQEDISVSKKKKNGVQTQTPLLERQNKERQYLAPPPPTSPARSNERACASGSC